MLELIRKPLYEDNWIDEVITIGYHTDRRGYVCSVLDKKKINNKKTMFFSFVLTLDPNVINIYAVQPD